MPATANPKGMMLSIALIQNTNPQVVNKSCCGENSESSAMQRSRCSEQLNEKWPKPLNRSAASRYRGCLNCWEATSRSFHPSSWKTSGETALRTSEMIVSSMGVRPVDSVSTPKHMEKNNPENSSASLTKRPCILNLHILTSVTMQEQNQSLHTEATARETSTNVCARR